MLISIGEISIDEQSSGCNYLEEESGVVVRLWEREHYCERFLHTLSTPTEGPEEDFAILLSLTSEDFVMPMGLRQWSS